MSSISEPFNTVWPADSVEFCPHEEFRSIFVCGTYLLEQDPSDTSDGKEAVNWHGCPHSLQVPRYNAGKELAKFSKCRPWRINRCRSHFSFPKVFLTRIQLISPGGPPSRRT